MTASPDPPDDSTARGVKRTTRRELLRGSAGALGAVAVGSTTVTAHEGHEATETGAEAEETETEEGDGIFSPAVVRESAPKVGSDSFVGLFIQIVGTTTEPDESGIGSCPTFGNEQPIATLRGRFLDLRGEDRRGEVGVLFIDAGNPDIQPGKLFIVNDQQPCEESFVQLTLEQVGASKIKVQAGTGTTEDSYTSTPGFGPVAALTGLVLGAAGVVRALQRE